jgi:mono/diheme cytochrome c family protein
MGGARLSGQSPQATQPPNKKSLKIVPIEQSKPNSGAQMFKDYCASCHGVGGRGDGPAVAFLKTPPPDLRLMAQRNSGKYPALRVKAILTQGPDSTRAHGDLDMPTWGGLFRSSHYGSPELRIANLTTFIESIQDK